MLPMYSLIIFIAGLVLIAMGLIGIWMGTNTPIQIQPIPLIVLILGLTVAALGGLIYFGTGPI